MKDKLEKFVTEHRDEFDSLEPSAGLFDNICPPEEETKVRRFKPYTFMWRAAVVVAIFTAGFLAKHVISEPKGNNTVVAAADTFDIEAEIPELIEAKMYYSTKVNSAWTQIEPMLTSDPELKSDVKDDLDELDSLYLELKNDLSDNVDNEEVIEAMIQNYRIKLQILEDLISYLKKSQDDESNAENI